MATLEFWFEERRIGGDNTNDAKGTVDWTNQLSSNFTYAENSLDNTPLQQPDDVHQTSYLSANLIWTPREHVKVGIEYLYGTRENVD